MDHCSQILGACVKIQVLFESALLSAGLAGGAELRENKQVNQAANSHSSDNLIPLRRKDDQARLNVYSKKHALNWFLLTFLAGTINVGGFMACQRFVTHVTGFATLFGADIVQGLWKEAIGIVSVPLFFIMGAMISAFLVERRVSWGKPPAYARVMGLVTFCISVVLVGGLLGWFGKFGGTYDITKAYLLLVMLCMASGLQNAVVTSVSGTIIRTTHLTGLTTDLGIGLVRILFPAPHQNSLDHEYLQTYLRIGSIGSFIAGSAIGAFIFLHFGYYGFLLPGLLALHITFIAKTVWEKPGFNAHQEIKSGTVTYKV